MKVGQGFLSFSWLDAGLADCMLLYYYVWWLQAMVCISRILLLAQHNNSNDVVLNAFHKFNLIIYVESV